MREVARHAAGRLHGAFDEREVDLADRMRRDLRAHRVERGLRPRREDEPRRAGVEPVQETGNRGVAADARQFRVARERRAGERAALQRPHRVARLSGGLVERDERVVLEDDGERRVRFRRDRAVARFGEVRHVDPRAGRGTRGLRGGTSVRAHAPRGEARGDERARRSRRARQDRLVEAPGGRVFRGDRERERTHGAGVYHAPATPARRLRAAGEAW